MNCFLAAIIAHTLEWRSIYSASQHSRYENRLKPVLVMRVWETKPIWSMITKGGSLFSLNPKTKMEMKTNCLVVLLVSSPHPDAHSWADKAFVLVLAFPACFSTVSWTTSRLLYAVSAVRCLFGYVLLLYTSFYLWWVPDANLCTMWRISEPKVYVSIMVDVYVCPWR